jgi:cysteine desulfurase / selenocysteine lyase
MTTSDHRVGGAPPEALEASAKEAGSSVPAANAIGILAGIDPGAIDRIASSVFSAMRGTPSPEAAIMSPPVPEAIPGAMMPGTTVPMSHPGAPMPSASAPAASMTTPPVPEAIPAVLAPGATIPMSRPEAPLPSASAPGAVITSPPAPEAIPAATAPGATVPISHAKAPIAAASAPGAAVTAPPVPEAAATVMIPGTTVPLSRPGTDSIPWLSAGAIATEPLPGISELPPFIGGIDGGLPPILDGAAAMPRSNQGPLIPGASAPGAVITAPPAPEAIPAVMIPGTAVPVSWPGIDSIPWLSARATTSEPLPGISELPPFIGGIDGGLPPILDGGVAMPMTPAVTPPGYYFLAPGPAPVSASAPAFQRRSFEVQDIRRDFPILSERVHGKRLIWLDNAATTHKPRAVIERLVSYYEHEYSNVHRGAHELAARSTNAYEGAREKVQHFLGASSPSEIVFVRGTTEAINLVAGSWGRRFVEKGDEIILTTIEHHSNIVPWQLLAESVGATIRVVPVTDRGEVLLDDYAKLLNSRTRLVALTHVSNALGTILPVREMIQMAHRYDVHVLVDGAQAVSHFPVNVRELDADFYALSGHKMFGPSGVGVLYAKRALLDEMPPWQGGGNMIQRVTFDKSTYAEPPARFEAGTATLGPAVGLGAAVDYLQSIGMENVARHEHELLVHATEALSRIPGLRLIGTAPDKASVLSFIVNGIEAEQMGRMLDLDGIAVRAGHHCAQPTMDRFGVTSTVRPSLALYNTHDEVDELARCVRKAIVQRLGNLR